MTLPPNPPPNIPLPTDPPPPVELTYETPSPVGNAPLLVRLAAIFLLVAAGLDVLAFVWEVISGIFGAMTFGMAAAAPAPPGGGGMPPSFAWIMIAWYVLQPMLSLAEASVKTIAGIKLLRKGKQRWAWGLIAAIAACGEIWSCFCCLPSAAAGIYTIVILCLPHVRTYLAIEAIPESAHSFPVSPDPQP
jgi:hypothetical protein